MLYYTGATIPEERQEDPSLSLGGFKSSSKIANGELHNLFPAITQSTVINNKKLIRMIVFMNLAPDTISNLKLYSTDGVYSTIKMAALLPGYDSKCDRYFFEKVSSETNTPYQGTLSQYGVDNPLTIDSLESGKMIGIWIQKTLKLDQFSDLEKGIEGELSCEETAQLLEQSQSIEEIEDLFNIHFQWEN